MTISTIEYLNNIDLISTRQKINEFKNLDFIKTTSYAIQEKLFDIFCITSDDGKKGFNYPNIESTIPTGEKFYRVWNGYDFFKALIKKEFELSHCWNNPNAPINRFNKEGEQALYLCYGSPETALFETGVKKGDVFTLFIYSTTKDIKLTETHIGNRWDTDSKLSAEHQEKADLLNNFLYNELCRKVNAGNEYLYNITNSIKHIFANWELLKSDGVRYVSAVNGKPNNVCLKHPDFISKIKIDAMATGIMGIEMKHYLFMGGTYIHSNSSIRTSLVDKNFLKLFIPSALYASVKMPLHEEYHTERMQKYKSILEN